MGNKSKFKRRERRRIEILNTVGAHPYKYFRSEEDMYNYIRTQLKHNRGIFK